MSDIFDKEKPIAGELWKHKVTGCYAFVTKAPPSWEYSYQAIVYYDLLNHPTFGTLLGGHGLLGVFLDAFEKR